VLYPQNGDRMLTVDFCDVISPYKYLYLSLLRFVYIGYTYIGELTVNFRLAIIYSYTVSG